MAAIDGRALKRWRERTGWKATVFAERVGISVQYLCDIEGGNRNLKRSPDLIRRMADVLDVPVTDLLYRELAS